MGKSTDIAKKNFENNINNAREGVQLFKDVKYYTIDVFKKDIKKKETAAENISRFLDIREFENLLIPFYFECIHLENGVVVLDKKKYENNINEFLDKMAYNPREDEAFKKAHKDDPEIDELGLEIYDRYYYNQLEPYFDKFYSYNEKANKANYDFLTKERKFSVEDFFALQFSYTAQQAIMQSVSNKYNKEYFSTRYKSYTDVQNFKIEDTLRFVKVSYFSNELIDHDIEDINNTQKNKYEFDDEAVDIYLNYINDKSHIEMNFGDNLYSLLNLEDDDDDTFEITDYFEFKFEIFNTAQCQNFRKNNQVLKSIFIDGVELDSLFDNKRKAYKYLAEKILEGTHAIEVVDFLEADGLVKPNIVPVKFKFNQKEYVRENYTYLDRFLNFLHIKNNIPDLNKNEKNNFVLQQQNALDRHKKICETIANDLKEFNKHISGDEGVVGFKSDFKELNFDRPVQRQIDVEEVKEDNIKVIEQNINKEIVKEKDKNEIVK